MRECRSVYLADMRMGRISRLFIHDGVRDNPLTQRIARKIHLSPMYVDRDEDVYQWVNESDDPIRSGKEALYLTANRGPFLRNCPGTKAYRCCGYKILHIGTYCVMDCAYCILQAYFHPPILRLFVNHQDLEQELDRFFDQNREVARIGTGEFTDSLIWERWCDLSEMLVTKFSKQNLSILELKTKTVSIESLRGLEHNRKTVLAWSLNTPQVIAREEKGTAGLDARLEAAARCQSWGYPLAFHFDPLIDYEGCEADYRAVVRKVFAAVSPENILWISLGAFRFMPGLKKIIEKRFPHSGLLYGEFIPGLDDKMRYFKPIRISLYRSLVNLIHELAPEVCVYFCMEDDHVWERCMGYVPEQRGGLPVMLDNRAVEICELSRA